jgi:hypothetical protein
MGPGPDIAIPAAPTLSTTPGLPPEPEAKGPPIFPEPELAEQAPTNCDANAAPATMESDL